MPLDEALDEFTRDGAPPDEKSLLQWLQENSDYVLAMWDVDLERALDFADFAIEDREVRDA